MTNKTYSRPIGDYLFVTDTQAILISVSLEDFVTDRHLEHGDKEAITALLDELNSIIDNNTERYEKTLKQLPH